MNRKDITDMKIKTYTSPDREVSDGFTCDNCGAIRNGSIGNGKWCAGFRADLITAPDGTVVKCFECTMACRAKLIAEGMAVSKEQRKVGF